jgi:Flp pilus assembly protein TadG
MDTAANTKRGNQAGQIIAIFALALVALIAMVGLVLDGGSAFAQRRDEQSAADLAALAGANDYLLNLDGPLATARAKSVAAANGYAHGVNGVTVTVGIITTNGAEVTVDISAPHRNNFASIVGMPTWAVATTATAQSGYPDTASGVAPMIFSTLAFDSNGQPLALYGDPAHPFSFGEINNPAPTTPGDFAWTNYGSGNVDTDGVMAILSGEEVIELTLHNTDSIGQQNTGTHAALFDSSKSCQEQPSIEGCLIGENVPVPIVDASGVFQGWATLHVTGADGGSSKSVTGYFVSSYVNERLTIKNCAIGSCPRYFGSPTIHLVN